MSVTGPDSHSNSCAAGNAPRDASGQEGTWPQPSWSVGAAAQPHCWARGWGDGSLPLPSLPGQQRDTRKGEKHTVLSRFPASQRSCWRLSRIRLKPLAATQSESEMPAAFCTCLLPFYHSGLDAALHTFCILQTQGKPLFACLSSNISCAFW